MMFVKPIDEPGDVSPATLIALLTAVFAVGPVIATRLDMLDAHDAEYLRVVCLGVYYPFVAALAVLMRPKAPPLAYWLAAVAAVLLFTSVAMGGFVFRPMLFIGPLMALLIFCIAPRSEGGVDFRPAFIVLFVAIAAPLALAAVAPSAMPLLTQSESFRGLMSSRTDYSYYAAIALIMAVAARPWWGPVCAIIAATAIALSASRSGVVATTVGVAVFAVLATWRQKSFHTPAVAFAAVTWMLIAPTLIGLQGRRVLTVLPSEATNSAPVIDVSNTRLDLFAHTWAQIENSWLFGAGRFYQHVPMGEALSEPHNSVLQSILNFGIAPTALWFALLVVFFFRVSPLGKGLVASYAVFGLFQPGLDAYLMTPESALPLILAAFSPLTRWGAPETPSHNYSVPL